MSAKYPSTQLYLLLMDRTERPLNAAKKVRRCHNSPELVKIKQHFMHPLQYDCSISPHLWAGVYVLEVCTTQKCSIVV